MRIEHLHLMYVAFPAHDVPSNHRHLPLWVCGNIVLSTTNDVLIAVEADCISVLIRLDKQHQWNHKLTTTRVETSSHDVW